jgi:hypothetical protein
MKISISLIALVLFTKSFAQNFSFSEQLHWGSSSNDMFKDALKIDDGYIVTASANGNDQSVSGSFYGYSDFWIFRLDINNNILFNKTFGGNGIDVPNKILKLSNGNFLIIGQSTSAISGNKLSPSFGNFDVWIICIDENGNKLWEKNYGTNANDYFASCIEISPNKSLIIISTEGGVSGNKTIPSKGMYDAWLIEIDNQGLILNQKVIGGSGDDYFLDLNRLNNNHLLLQSYSTSGISGDRVSQNYGNEDAWIVEIDTNYNILNQFVYGGDGFDELLLIEETANSYLFGGISGSTISGNKISPKRCSIYDGILLKTTKTYDVEIEKSFGHSSGSYYMILQQINLSNNQKILCGQVSGGISSFNDRPTHGSQDIWLMQVDDSLNQTWNYSFGGALVDGFVKGFASQNDDIEIFGYYDSPASYDISVSSFGYQDILYVKLSSDLSILESQLAVGVYPNPSRGIFHVTSATPISAYSVFSVDGRLQANGTTLTGSLDLQHLPAGTYIANFVSGKTSSSLKLVIE